MTKEQEVVEKVNRIRIDFFDSKYKDVHTDDELEEKYEALGDVLNMLKEKDEEIERLRYIKKSFDYVVQKETEKKDKIIDLMAKAMDKIQDPQVCKYCDNKINLNHGYCTDAGKCKKGIKQYFERKSEE